MKVTLDTMNCLIALEKGDSTASAYADLIALCHSGNITLIVPWNVVLENTKNRTMGEYGNLIERLDGVGLTHPNIWLLKKPEIVGHEFAYKQELHKILAQNVEFNYAEHILAQYKDLGLNVLDSTTHAGLERDWFNAKNDVEALFTHVTLGGDIFVTGDKRHFHTQERKIKLLKYVQGKILLPEEAVDYICQTLSIARQDVRREE